MPVLRRRSPWLLIALTATLWVTSRSARGEWEPSGAITVHALIAGGGAGEGLTLGAGSLVDLWEPIGPFRVGAAIGMAAMTSEDASRSRVLMPGGLSMAVVGRRRAFGFDLRLRGGAWGGAVETGLAAGAWVAVGAHIEYAPSLHVALAAGMDVWFLFGHGHMRVAAPGVGLVWTFDGDRDER
jgi:hypothetical protein